jgi:hypothetical protein
MENIEKTGLTPPKTAMEILDMYYLEARSHLLETAAILDRIERAVDGDKAIKDLRIKKLYELCEMLTKEKTNRAERFLEMLSIS